MRIVSWNLHGAAVPGRASIEQQHRAWRYMRGSLRADLILAQEVSLGGIPGDVTDEWTVVSGEMGRHRKTWRWGSVIAATPSLQLRERSDLSADRWLAELYDLVLFGDILVGGTRLCVASVHTAAMRVDGWLQQYATTLSLCDAELVSLRRPGCSEHPYINDFAFVALERVLRTERFFVAGDWNTCRKYAGGDGFFDRARDAGWVRCHGKAEIPTYHGRGTSEYQLDHAFCDAATARAITCAQVIDYPLVRELSDHSPILVELDLDADHLPEKSDGSTIATPTGMS